MRNASVVICALLLAGCASVLKQAPPREPDVALPAAFSAAPAAAIAPGSAAGSVEPTPSDTTRLPGWKEFFDDPGLDGLIDAALEHNQELNLRLQEIVVAQSEIMARRGEYLPFVRVATGAGVEKVGKETSQGASDEALELPDPLAHYRLGFAASWEVDAWKRLRNAAKAASYRYLASVEGRNFLVTQVVAEIASSYYELMALDNELAVLRNNIAIQQSALQVVRLQKEAARATELAVQRFEAEVLKNQSRRFALEQQRVQAENRINFLLGRYPQPIVPDPEQIHAQTGTAAGVPSQLLDNRPDVRQAAAELEATKLDVASARAAFYPSLSIDAGAGYEAFNVKHLLFTPESTLFGVAGNLVAPLLNRNAIKAQYAAANAQQLQAVFNYERTLLQAYTEVANQMAAIGNLERSYALQAQQVDTLNHAIDVSNVLFQSARADYMEVLLTRRDALDAQMELIETRNQQMQARVRMYQALGGGWR